MICNFNAKVLCNFAGKPCVSKLIQIHGLQSPDRLRNVHGHYLLWEWSQGKLSYVQSPDLNHVPAQDLLCYIMLKHTVYSIHVYHQTEPCWAKMKRTWGFSVRCDLTCEESSAFLARCPDAVRPSNSTCHSLNLSQLLGCQPSCKLDLSDLFLQTWATQKKGPNGRQQYACQLQTLQEYCRSVRNISETDLLKTILGNVFFPALSGPHRCRTHSKHSHGVGIV